MSIINWVQQLNGLSHLVNDPDVEIDIPRTIPAKDINFVRTSARAVGLDVADCVAEFGVVSPQVRVRIRRQVDDEPTKESNATPVIETDVGRMVASLLMGVLDGRYTARLTTGELHGDERVVIPVLDLDDPDRVRIVALRPDNIATIDGGGVVAVTYSESDGDE